MRSTIPAVAILAFSLACGGAPKPEAKIAILESDLDDSCSSLLDYCVVMRCKLRNTGDAEGTATVKFTLFQDDNNHVVAQEFAELKPNESTWLSHQFTEAKLFSGGGERSQCAVERIQTVGQ